MLVVLYSILIMLLEFGTTTTTTTIISSAFLLPCNNKSTIRSISSRRKDTTLLRAYPNKNDLKYIRIVSKTSRGYKRKFELQTAIARMIKVDKITGQKIVVDLHSQIHFGDHDYFSFYNNNNNNNNNILEDSHDTIPSFSSKVYDRIHYELIVSQDMMQTRNKDGTRFLKPRIDGTNPMMPSPVDVNTAKQYGLTCQLDVIDYTQNQWVHADYTREEYLSLTQQQQQQNKREFNINPNDNMIINNNLWALASTTASPIMEFISPLFRPLTPSTPPSLPLPTRRLFSNLFLPGDNITSLLRILLWTFTPSPEVSVMLLDWSSLRPKPTGGISQIVIPVLQCLTTGNLDQARRLVFAQLLVNGQTGGGKDELLVQRRNQHAIDVLSTSISNSHHNHHHDVDDDDKSSTSSSSQTHALLYGAMHCPDLQTRLERMGYTLEHVHYRRAWSMDVPIFGTGPSSSTIIKLPIQNFVSTNDPESIAIGLVIIPLYLLIGGLDWLGTVQDLAKTLDDGYFWDDGPIIAFLYLMRHVALYLGLTKFVVEWDGEMNLFGQDSNL